MLNLDYHINDSRFLWYNINVETQGKGGRPQWKMPFMFGDLLYSL